MATNTQVDPRIDAVAEQLWQTAQTGQAVAPVRDRIEAVAIDGDVHCPPAR